MAQIGDLLKQRYRIEQCLGQGGMGTVYKARDTQNKNRICAVKENVINPQDPPQEQQAQREQFEREAKILQGLRPHYNLPQVYDYFVEPNQQQYIVMEFVLGDNLETIVQQRGVLAEDQMMRWLLQICDAVIYLHQNRIIHRDIKPTNILITPRDRAVLVDFGIAKVYDPSRPTTRGARAVTPGYSPLEQYYHGGTNQRSDIYALGATMYFCLTSQAPPEATQRADPSSPVPLVPPRQRNPQVSTAMDQLIVKMLAVSQNDRYQTMVEVRAALDAIQRGKPLMRFTGTVQQIGQPSIYSNGYSRKHYTFLLTVPNGQVPCELKGYMLPLILFNGDSVTVEGAFDSNNILQVTKLTDLKTQRSWVPRATLGWWERLQIELGLMKP